MNYTSRERAEKDPDYVAMKQQIESMQAAAKQKGNRDQSYKSKAAIKMIQDRLDGLLNQFANVGKLDQKLINGFRLMFQTFLPDRINLRMFPFPDVPTFQLIANLKRNCILDTDLDHLIFSYGPRPNVELTILGLVTSSPQPTAHPLDSVRASAPKLGDVAGAEAVEAGLRPLFWSIEAVEQFLRFSWYPRVTLYPIAVYRRIRSSA